MSTSGQEKAVEEMPQPPTLGERRQLKGSSGRRPFPGVVPRPPVSLKPGRQGEEGLAILEEEGNSGPVLGEAQSGGPDLA